MKLYRCRWDKKIAGICGGLGQYFKIDPTIIRISLLIVTFLTGILPMAALYLIAWAAMPLGPKHYVEIPRKKLYRSRKNRKISGICGGLAEYFKIDATLVRIAVIALLLITFAIPVIVSYLIGTFIIPENPDQ